MRPYLIISLIAIASLWIYTGCKKDSKDLSLPSIRLSTPELTGRSENQILDTLIMKIPDGFQSLVITKGVNLVPDSSYGTVTVLSVTSTGTNTYQFIFSYTCSPDEVDKLVGFNFRLTDKKGRAMETDLTLHTMAGAAQTLYSHRWQMVSEFWQTGNPPQTTTQLCLTTYVYSFKRDSTMSLNLGAGGGCSLDALFVYTKWTLSEDEKTLTMYYYNVFNPTANLVKTYTMINITNSQLVMSTLVDLSWAGATDHEVFVYTLNALPL